MPDDTAFAVASRRYLPLYPTARLATMAFGIPVVCTPDAPNGWRALLGGHWDPSSCLCQHARVSAVMSPREGMPFVRPKGYYCAPWSLSGVGERVDGRRPC